MGFNALSTPINVNHYCLPPIGIYTGGNVNTIIQCSLHLVNHYLSHTHTEK